MHRFMFVALAAAAAGAAVGQSAAPPDPTNPAARVAPLEYRSAFAGYQRQSELPLAPWRAANESVAQSAGQGGHAGRTAQPSASSKPPAKPAAGTGHGSHR